MVKTGKKTFHVCMNLDALERMLMADEPTYLMVGERFATKKEIWENVYEALAKGYTVLPPCDNVDETGHCKGHECAEGD